MADSITKQVEGFTGEISGTINQMERIVKAALGVKAPNKDTYKPALLFEPKIDAFLKEGKGKAKTMRVQLGEIVKKVGVNGMKERYFKPQHDRADKAITQMEAALDNFVNKSAPLRKLIEIGKKAK